MEHVTTELEAHMLQMDVDGETIVPSGMSSRKIDQQTLLFLVEVFYGLRQTTKYHPPAINRVAFLFF